MSVAPRVDSLLVFAHSWIQIHLQSTCNSFCWYRCTSLFWTWLPSNQVTFHLLRTPWRGPKLNLKDVSHPSSALCYTSDTKRPTGVYDWFVVHDSAHTWLASMGLVSWGMTSFLQIINFICVCVCSLMHIRVCNRMKPFWNKKLL